SARAFCRLMAGRDIAIAGTTRDATKLEALSALGLEPFVFDGTRISEDVTRRLRTATHLVVSAAPGEAGDPVLGAAQSRLGEMAPRLEWVGYLSTVGVYGDHAGAWVDEDTPCRPVSRRSRWRLEVEQAWLNFGREAGVPVAVLRLG